MKNPCFLSKSGIDLAASIREQIALHEKADQRAYLFELFFIHARRVAGAIQTFDMTYAELAASDLFLALAATFAVMKERLPHENRFFSKVDSLMQDLEERVQEAPSCPANIHDLFSLASEWRQGGQ